MTVPDARAAASPRSSLLYYSPALMLLRIVVADSAQFPDSDLWGHLRFRQAGLTSGHIVARDSYSYGASDGLWRNHEWLTEIVMAVVYNHLGVVGLKLWKFTCLAATIVLMATGMAETDASPVSGARAVVADDSDIGAVGQSARRFYHRNCDALSLHQRGWIAGFGGRSGRAARASARLDHTSRERWQL